MEEVVKMKRLYFQGNEKKIGRTCMYVFCICITAFLCTCEDNYETFFVDYIRNTAKPPECSYSAASSATKEEQSWAKVDVFLAGIYGGEFFNYVRSFVLRNDMTARMDPANNITESNGIIVEGAWVKIMWGDEGRDDDEHFSEFAHYLLEPQNQGGMFATLLEWPEISRFFSECEYHSSGWPTSKILEEIVVSVRFVGHTQSGMEVETPEYFVPIQICCGCLISWDNSCNNTTWPARFPECCDIEPEGDVPCRPGQDHPLACGVMSSCKGAAECSSAE